MNGGCPATIGTIDSDEQSRLYVAGAVSMAQIAIAAAQPFAMRWRLLDNSYADLDAADMIGMGVELGVAVAAARLCHGERGGLAARKPLNRSSGRGSTPPCGRREAAQPVRPRNSLRSTA